MCNETTHWVGCHDAFSRQGLQDSFQILENKPDRVFFIFITSSVLWQHLSLLKITWIVEVGLATEWSKHRNHPRITYWLASFSVTCKEISGSGQGFFSQYFRSVTNVSRPLFADSRGSIIFHFPPSSKMFCSYLASSEPHWAMHCHQHPRWELTSGIRLVYKKILARVLQPKAISRVIMRRNGLLLCIFCQIVVIES